MLKVEGKGKSSYTAYLEGLCKKWSRLKRGKKAVLEPATESILYRQIENTVINTEFMCAAGWMQTWSGIKK